MIPAGILSQNSRDLSKEIWISWGYGYPQEQGVFVNALDYSWSGFIPLKNALNQSTGFSLYLFNWNYGASIVVNPTGALDIINRNELILSNWSEDDVYSQVTMSYSNPSPQGIEMYTLAGRSAGISLSHQGWGAAGNVFQSAVPIQSDLEITPDWDKIEELTATTSQEFVLYPGEGWDIGRIRAIVIKLI